MKRAVLLLLLCLPTLAAASSADIELGSIVFVTTDVSYYGAGDILVVERNSRRNVTSTPRVHESTPAWSPDGSRIAFVRGVGGHGDIYVQGVSGPARQLTNTANDDSWPEWSQDSTLIAFVRTNAETTRETRDLWLMRSDGSEQRRLTNLGAHELFSPSWSPDGRQIAFLFDRAVHVVSIDGSGERGVWSAQENASSAYRLVWQLDGSIDFLTEGGPSPPRWRVFSTTADGAPPRQKPTPCRGDELPIWSTDRGVVVCSANGHAVVRMVTLQGAFLRRVRLLPPNQSFGNVDLSISRQSRLAFSAAVEEKDGDLATMRADGTKRRILLVSPDEEYDPAVSPDGRLIAFVRNEYQEFGDGRLLITDWRGRRVRPLRAGLRGESPSWSPDGRNIVFSRGGSIFIIPFEGGRARRIAKGRQPDWSPDGRWIAFSAADGLRVVNPDRTVQRLLVRRRGDVLDPDWNLDSQRIVFSDYDSLLVTSLRGGTKRLLSDEDNPLSSPTWSPGGRRIAFAAGWRNDIPYPWAAPTAHFLGMYVIGLDERRPRSVATGFGWDTHPTWSR